MMDAETKQMIVVFPTLIIALGMFIFAGHSCDKRENETREKINNQVLECIKAGQDVLACKRALQIEIIRN